MGKEKVSITIENPMINITGTMNIDLVVKIKNNVYNAQCKVIF